MNNLNLGIVPMTSTDKAEVNLEAILKGLEFFDRLKSQGKKTHLISLPENCLYLNLKKTIHLDDAITLESPLWAPLCARAQSLEAYIHLGAMPLDENGRMVNATVLISPKGKVEVVYRKIHLFDVNVEGRVYQESASFAAGTEPSVIDVGGWKIGLSVCYDLRFAELFVHYHRNLVDLILVPAAFTVPTGRAHWSTLLKARAIETQAFVAAAAQVGTHRSVTDSSLPERETWGQSIVFGPWGECLGQTPSFDDAMTGGEPLAPLWVELDKALIQKARTQIPLLSHRKLK